MLIIFNQNAENTVKLSDLHPGSVFEHENGFYLRTSEYLEETITCVELITGDVDWFAKGTRVIERNAKVVIDK